VWFEPDPNSSNAERNIARGGEMRLIEVAAALQAASPSSLPGDRTSRISASALELMRATFIQTISIAFSTAC
jgi:hypothetical protein